MTEADQTGDRLDRSRPSLATVLREWGRIGCIGFGGPPTHIKLLRELCVERKRWIAAVEFEDAIAACNLLPGPASTQLSIFCAWRVRGRLGAVVGGTAFIVPGLIVILALAALFLGTPPPWVLAAGAGAGSAVPAVAVHAATGLLPASWHRAHGADRGRLLRSVEESGGGCSHGSTTQRWGPVRPGFYQVGPVPVSSLSAALGTGRQIRCRTVNFDVRVTVGQARPSACRHP